jgi:hypothetical protein
MGPACMGAGVGWVVGSLAAGVGGFLHRAVGVACACWLVGLAWGVIQAGVWGGVMCHGPGGGCFVRGLGRHIA